MMEQSGLWEQKAEALGQFLETTKKIAGILARMETDAAVEEPFKEIEQLIHDRGGIIERMNALVGTLEDDDALLSAEEKKQKWLCKELLGQIEVIEEKNRNTIDGIMDGYRQQMRFTRQSRDTIGAYSQHMHSAEALTEGTIFNKMK